MAKRRKRITHVDGSDADEIMAQVKRDIQVMGDERTPAKEGRATGAGKGRQARIGPDGKVYSTDEIIEYVRTLLIDGHLHGDIKRALVKRFGGTGRSFAPHISVARKRNLGVLNKKPEQTKSESIMLRFKSLQDAKGFRLVAQRDMSDAQRKIDSAQKELDSKPSAVEMAKLIAERDDARKSYNIAFERFTEFDAIVDRNQTVIDRLIGNNAPIEFKAKIKTEVKSEPLTHDELESELAELLALAGIVK